MDVSKHRPKAVLDYITVSRSVFIKIVHFVPALNKSCAIWALGLLHHLICLFHFASRTYHTQVWQRRLQNLGINPESYTFVFFQCTAVAYLKMQFNLPNSASLSYEQAGRFYIGPTSIGMAKREFDRMAKYRLAKDGTPVHVELAVKYWCCTDFVIIWNSQRVVEQENFLHQPWSSEIWRFQNWIVQRPCHFWHPPIFQHKFQDFYAIMSWSTRKLQFRCIFQPQNWGKLHRHFRVFYIITRSMSTSTLYRIRPSWHVRALNWLPKFRKIWQEQLQYWTKFTVVLRSPMKISKPNFFDSGPLTPRSCTTIPDFPSRTSSASFTGMWTMDLFCLTAVFAPHCLCKCFPIVSFIKRRWSWKPSKMVHSLGSPSMWCNEP